MAKNEHYLYLNGKKIVVSAEVYKAYWKITEHERYLKRKDKENHVLTFSSFDHDGHFESNIVDEKTDVEESVDAKMQIDNVRNAIARLSEEEREIIMRLYFNDETLRDVARSKDMTHPALIKRRNKILQKLKKMIKEI
ncbi:DNA-binding protein [Streptococcus equi subsp. zooepidemicus SzS31A1]|uniref:DNA-binding protein n=1 Tax=Streptococcus equi subsp. zooepidemicus SzS31A1 TaxID=1352602 RepID=A0ABP2XB70_STRSZ|nr:sigma-70 family RNA polymerase sigma factor [Streptococcus equi]EQB23950.1 DNA-binding protein [Streptococcus equi subsp. zooepidemicus SzS31A1]